MGGLTYPASWGADYRWRREAEAVIRRARLPVWAEWAAWRWSRGDAFQKAIGIELGGFLATTVSNAIKDYLFIATDAPFWLNKVSYGYDHGYWSIGIHGEQRRELLRHHFGDHVPPFPGRVSVKHPVDLSGRNEWIYQQRQEGRTLASIGAEIGLCNQRIRQICQRVERLKAPIKHQ